MYEQNAAIFKFGVNTYSKLNVTFIPVSHTHIIQTSLKIKHAHIWYRIILADTHTHTPHRNIIVLTRPLKGLGCDAYMKHEESQFEKGGKYGEKKNMVEFLSAILVIITHSKYIVSYCFSFLISHGNKRCLDKPPQARVRLIPMWCGSFSIMGKCLAFKNDLNPVKLSPFENTLF